MSAGLSFNSVSSSTCASSTASAYSSSSSSFDFKRCVIFCLVKQKGRLSHSSDSMRLWPKRNSSGAECFNGFHIQRFAYLLLFLRS
ncbi:hypothetical protein QQ045_020064 [Rhodiola kirilowii]